MSLPIPTRRLYRRKFFFYKHFNKQEYKIKIYWMPHKKNPQPQKASLLFARGGVLHRKNAYSLAQEELNRRSEELLIRLCFHLLVRKSNTYQHVSDDLSGSVSFSCVGDSTRIILVLTMLSLQSCPTLCDPIDGSPRGSPIPGILQARALEWVAISFSNA